MPLSDGGKSLTICIGLDSLLYQNITNRRTDMIQEATANRSRISFRVTKILGQSRGRG